MEKDLDGVVYEAESLHYIMSKEMIDKYDFLKTKENVDDLISQYKTAKFEFLVSNSILEKVSSCYQPRYNKINTETNDKIGDNISKKIDSKNLIDYFDAIFNPLFEILTSQERKYYSLCLINNSSEQTASDIIGVSRTGLQPIKQNCILKIALAFHIAVLK